MADEHRKDELYENLFKSIKSWLGIDPDSQSLTPEEAVKNMPSEEMRNLLFQYSRGKLLKEDLLQKYTPELAEYLWLLFEDAKKRAEEEKKAEEDLKKGGKDPQPEDQPELVTISESQTVH